MAGKAQTKFTPEMTRVMIRSVALEAPFLIGGVAVLLLTQNYLWFVVLVGMGIVVFMASFLPAYLRFNADAAREDAQAPIVEDPHGRL